MERGDVWTKIDDVLETLEGSTLVDDDRRASTRLGAAMALTASAMGGQQCQYTPKGTTVQAS